jgi:hypothetical protein
MVMRSVIEKNQSNSRNHNFLSETISIDDGKNHRNFTSRIVAIPYLGNNWNVFTFAASAF